MDSIVAFYIAKKGSNSARIKDIDVEYHHLCNWMTSGVIRLENISTLDQLADILTKPLALEIFNKISKKLVYKFYS